MKLESPETHRVRVAVHGTDRAVECSPGESLLSALRRAGFDVDSECGGDARCGLCRVRFLESAPEATGDDVHFCGTDAVAEGWRLACHARPTHDGRVELPPSLFAAPMRIVSDGDGEAVAAGAVARPTGYGAAVDIGTTTVAGYLVHLPDARPAGVTAFANPQRAYGHDVISRIVHAHRGETECRELQSGIVSAIEAHLLDLCTTREVDPRDVVALTAVGNQTMMHLLWGIDPWPLGVAPYEPALGEVTPVRGRELGFDRFAHARITMLPGIGGQLGADTVAGLLALGPRLRQGPTLFIDLGTNGEIVLAHDDTALGCTCAAGPAFEGVHVSCGAPAVAGAVERVEVEDGDLRLYTIDDALPVGLCGSGLADTIAVLLRSGLLDPGGRLAAPGAASPGTPPALAARLVENVGERTFLVHHGESNQSIALTQRDIREVQLAKAAVRTGVEMLLEEAELPPNAVTQVFVGGAFGSALRPESVIALGVLPEEFAGRIRPVGNVAGVLQLAVLFEEREQDARALARWVRHVSLAEQQAFHTAFAARLAFPAPAA